VPGPVTPRFSSLLLPLPSHSCREKVAHLRKVRAGGVVGDQMFALRADLLRNLGNITNRCVCVRACMYQLQAHGGP
jgi:hypothetical protein